MTTQHTFRVRGQCGNRPGKTQDQCKYQTNHDDRHDVPNTFDILQNRLLFARRIPCPVEARLMHRSFMLWAAYFYFDPGFVLAKLHPNRMSATVTDIPPRVAAGQPGSAPALRPFRLLAIRDSQ